LRSSRAARDEKVGSVIFILRLRLKSYDVKMIYPCYSSNTAGFTNGKKKKKNKKLLEITKKKAYFMKINGSSPQEMGSQ